MDESCGPEWGVKPPSHQIMGKRSRNPSKLAKSKSQSAARGASEAGEAFRGMEHEAELRELSDAAAAATYEISSAQIQALYQALADIDGLDASKATKVLAYAMPHAQRGRLLADAGPLRQALQDIEDAEGPEVNAQCHEALRILLNTLNA